MKNVVTLLMLAAVIALSVYGQETVDRIIVVVDDNIILESEVLQFAQSLAIQNRVDPLKYIQNEEIRAQILAQLIEQQVLLAKAKEDTNVFVEDREIKREMDSRLEMMIGEVGSEAELEKVYGKPMRDIKREFEKTIYEGIMVDKLRQSKIMGIKVSRAEIEEFYEENKDRISTNPETIGLSHILLNIEPSVDAESQAKALIDSLKQVVQNGSDFAELAEQFSQDPGSGKRGGKLGWTKRGDFVPAFEEAAFNLKAGQISDPVKTQFGYHIVLLNERQGEKINTSHILIKLEPTENDRLRVLALADSIYSLLQSGSDFGEMAKEFSQDKTTSPDGGALGTFTLSEMIPVFVEQIKDLEPGQYTAPFESVMGVQLLKVTDRQKPRELTLGEDWNRISQMAINFKQEKEYIDWVESIKKDVYIDIRE